MHKTSHRSIIKNLFSLTAGQALTFVLTFLSLIIAARFLGVEGYGKFNAILALITILSRITDFGFNPIVFREISKNNKDYVVLSTGISLRILLFLGTVLSFNTIAFVSKMNLYEISLSNILLTNIIFSAKFLSFRELYYIIFKVDLKSHYPMLFNNLDNIFLLFLVILIPIYHLGITFFTIAYTISNVPGFILTLFYSYKKYGYKYKIDFSNAKWLLKESFPLFGYSLFFAIFLQVDILILKYFDGEYAAGIYSVATRSAIPLNIIPLALITTVVPIIIKNVKGNELNNFVINGLVYKILFLFAFISSAIVTIKSKEIIVLIFGSAYTESYMPTLVLLWTNIFVFHGFFSVELLTIYNKQKYCFIYSLVIVLLNLVFIILFIKPLSFNGVAYAKLLAAFGGVIFLLLIHSKYKIRFKYINFKILLWGIALLLTLFILSFLPLFVYLLLSILSVIVLIYKIRIFANEELEIIFKIIGKEELFSKFKA